MRPIKTFDRGPLGAGFAGLVAPGKCPWRADPKPGRAVQHAEKQRSSRARRDLRRMPPGGFAEWRKMARRGQRSVTIRAMALQAVDFAGAPDVG